MSTALDMCLGCGGKLDWAAEHDAEVALRMARGYFSQRTALSGSTDQT
ncbi:MAG: hypothetical protein ABTQ34_07215 [Bdellovibrionales bacterium]